MNPDLQPVHTATPSRSPEATPSAAWAVCLGTGVFCLLAVLCVVAVYSAMQIVRINLPSLAMIAGAIIAIPLTLAACPSLRQSVGRATIAVTLGLAGLAASLCVAASIVELQYDARWYHLEATIQLAEGWNAVWEPCQPRVSDIARDDFVGQKWWRIQCNSKAPYYFGTPAYAVTKAIDSSKASGIVLLTSCLLLWLAIAGTFDSWWERLTGVLLALAISVSPMVATQWTTAYIDDDMALLLAILTATTILAVRGSVSTLVPVVAIVLLLATKVTAIFILAAAAIPLALAMVYLRPCRWRDLHLPRNAAVLAALVLLICANPLITNTIRYSHPLYPYNEKKGGEGDIPARLNVTLLERAMLPAIGSFCTSRHHAETMVSRKEILAGQYLKSPFSITTEELRWFANSDVRVGGMGPLFPLALLLSMATGCILFVQSWKAGLFWAIALAAVYASLIPSGLGFYARYNPQWWMALFLPLLFAGHFRRSLLFRTGATALLIVAAANVALIAYSHGHAVLAVSNDYRKQYADADHNSLYLVDFERFDSDRKRLEEYGIHCREEPLGSQTPVMKLGGTDVVRIEKR